jgi:hypothetical protein
MDKPIGLMRPSGFGGLIESRYNLEDWGKRILAHGLGKRADLVALAATTDLADKKTLNAICERAHEAGGGNFRRDLGSAMHAELEHITTTGNLPRTFIDEMNAIASELDRCGFTILPEYSERMVANFTIGYGGTMDGILRGPDGKLRAFDLKTGSHASILGCELQLGAYVHAEHLFTQGVADDGSEDTCEPMPEIEQDWAVVIHIQPGSTHCELLRVDVAHGWELLPLALAVREAQSYASKARKLPSIAPATVPTVEEAVEMVMAAFPGAEPVTHVNDTWRAWMTTRLLAIKAAGAIDALAMHWPTGVPAVPSGDPITIEQSIDIERAVSLVESNAGLAFPEPIEPLAAPKPTPISDRRPRPDEGATVAEDVVAIINGLAQSLSITDRSWVLGIITRCHNANYPIRMSGPGGKPTARRAAICTALVTLAPFGDEALVRALVGLAISEDLQPGHDLAAAFGSLTLNEAQRLQRLANAVANTFLVPIWGEDGVAITGDITAALAA